MLQAIETSAAGSRVQGNNLHTAAKIAHARPNFFNHAGKFVSEQRRRHNHARVVAALVDLEVGPAGKRHVHLHQHLAGFERGNGHLLDLDVLFAIEDCSCHLSFQIRFSHSNPGWMTIFIESGAGCDAIWIASTDFSSGNR